MKILLYCFGGIAAALVVYIGYSLYAKPAATATTTTAKSPLANVFKNATLTKTIDTRVSITSAAAMLAKSGITIS